MTTDHRDCLGREIGSYPTGDFTAGGFPTWPRANTAILIPFRVWSPAPAAVQMFYVGLGGGGVGNGELGLYDSNLNRLGHTGTFAAISGFDAHALTATETEPYSYMALVFDNAAQQVVRATNIAGPGPYLFPGPYDEMGMLSMAAAYPLPATITPDPFITFDFVPMIGLSYRSVV